MTASTPKTKILIAGGGFGGVRAALKLADDPDLEITLVSATEHFSYYPQLYHAATGGTRSEAAIPLAELFASRPVKIIHDTVTVLDPDKRTLTGASGANYLYDQLILALGSVTNYFGIQGLKDFSYDIKTIEGAEAFKHHLHEQLTLNQRPELHYVVVGGGPTGVELAAALGEYLGRIVRRHNISAPKYQVDLVEAAPRLLPRLPENLSARVQRRLESLGVKVMTGAVVEAETADTLRLKGQSITTHTVIWTAGVSNNAFFANNADHFTIAKNHKVEVNEHLEARPDIYVIGDGAATQFSGMAQTAINDANFVTADIIRKRAGRPRPAYHQPAPVSVIPVGLNWAAVQWGSFQLYGYLGWVLRRFADLIGYSDIESPGKAFRLWLKDGRYEDNCPQCEQTTA